MVAAEGETGWCREGSEEGVASHSCRDRSSGHFLQAAAEGNKRNHSPCTPCEDMSLVSALLCSGTVECVIS